MNCPTGYEQLFSFKFLGTMSGCDCTKTTTEMNKKYTLECKCNLNNINIIYINLFKNIKIY